MLSEGGREAHRGRYGVSVRIQGRYAVSVRVQVKCADGRIQRNCAVTGVRNVWRRQSARDEIFLSLYFLSLP